MFVKRIEEVCGEVVEIVECSRCGVILAEEEYNSETGTWTCVCCGDESEDDCNIKVIDEREDYRADETGERQALAAMERGITETENWRANL